jgi:hypothetical protein
MRLKLWVKDRPITRQEIGDSEMYMIQEFLTQLEDEEGRVYDFVELGRVVFPTLLVDPCEVISLHGRGYIIPDLVKKYAEEMQRGDVFPPIVVINSDGDDGLVILDGKHRSSAACALKLPWIRAIDLAGARTIYRDGKLVRITFAANRLRRAIAR